MTKCECLWVKDALPPHFTAFLKCLMCDKRTYHAEPLAADIEGEIALIKRCAIERRWIDYKDWAP